MTHRIVQENVETSTWKDVFGGIISRLMLCQFVNMSKSPILQVCALGLVESFWWALLVYNVYFISFFVIL